MATVNRVRTWTVYLIALLVTGLSSIAGRPGPAWAEGARRERDAAVFQREMTRTAQNASDVDKYQAKPGIAHTHPGEDKQVDPVVREKLRTQEREIEALQRQVQELQAEIRRLKQAKGR